MKCLRRGVIDPVSLILIVVLGLSAMGVVSMSKFTSLFHSNDSKQKAQVTQLTNDVAAARKAEADARAAQAAAEANAKALSEARQARVDGAHEFIVGTGLALAKEPNQSINVQVAALLAKDADFSLDPLPAVRNQEIIELVNKLTAQNETDRQAANVQLSALNDALAAERAKESTLAAQQAELSAKNAQAQDLVSSLQNKASDDAKSLAKWASDDASLWQRFKSFVIWTSVFGAMYLFTYWALPVLAKAYPVFAPIATLAAKIMGYPLHLLHAAELEIVKLAHEAIQAKLTTTQTQLASEQAAHAATTATLVKVALTPDLPASTVTIPA